MYELEVEAPLPPLPPKQEFVAVEPDAAPPVEEPTLPALSVQEPSQPSTDLERTMLSDPSTTLIAQTANVTADVATGGSTEVAKAEPAEETPTGNPAIAQVAKATLSQDTVIEAKDPLQGAKQLIDIAGTKLSDAADATGKIASSLATETGKFVATVSDGKNWQKAGSEIAENPLKAATETVAGALNSGYNIVGGLTTLVVGGGGSVIQEVAKLPENAGNAVKILTNNASEVSQVAPTTAFGDVSNAVQKGHSFLSNVAGYIIDNGSETASRRHDGDVKAATSSMYDVGGTITNVGTIVAPMIKGALAAKAATTTSAAATGTATAATETVATAATQSAAAQTGNALQKAGQALANTAQAAKSTYGAVKTGFSAVDDGLKFIPRKATEFAGELAKKAGPLQAPLEATGKALQGVTGAIMDPAGSMQSLAVGAFNARNQVFEAISYGVKSTADDAFGKLMEATPTPVLSRAIMAESGIRQTARAAADATGQFFGGVGEVAGRVASPLQSLAQKPVTAFAEKFPQTAAKMQASASAIPGAVRDAAINTTSAVFGVAQDLATLGSRSLGYVNGAALGDMALNGGPKVTVNNEHTRKVNNMHDSSSNVTITAPNIPIGLALSADPKLINRLPFVPGLNEAQGNAMPRTDVRYEGDDPYRARQITTGSIRPFGEINLSYMAGSKEIGFVSSTTIAPHEALYNFAAVEFDKNTRPNNDPLSLSSYLGNTFLKISGSNRFNLGPLAVLIPRMSATTPLAEITNDKGQAPLVLGGRDDIGRGPAITLNPSSGFLNPATRGADWTPQKAFAEIFKPIPTTTYTPTK